MPICPQGCRPLPLTLLAWAGGASKQPTAATTHRSFMPVILGARRPDTCERTRGQTGPVAAASPGMGGGWAPGFQGLLDLAPNAAIPPSPQCWGARKKEGVSWGPDPRSGPLIPRPEAHSPLRPLRPHETWGAESGSSGPTAKQARPHPRPGVTRGPSGPSRSRTPPPLPASPASSAVAARDPAGPAPPGFHWLPPQSLSRWRCRPGNKARLCLGAGTPRKGQQAFSNPEQTRKASVGLPNG